MTLHRFKGCYFFGAPGRLKKTTRNKLLHTTIT